MHNLSKVGLGIAGALVAREIYGFAVVQVRKHQDINELINNVELLQEHFQEVIKENTKLWEVNNDLEEQNSELRRQNEDLEAEMLKAAAALRS